MTILKYSESMSAEELKNQYEGFHAEFYDIMHADSSDVPFYLELAKKYGEPILEIGSGTGRILIPFLKKEHKITAIEPFPEMISICKNKAQMENLTDVNIIQATAGDFKTDIRFKFALIACNTFQHFLSTEEQKAALTNIKKHLAPGGKLIIDMCVPDIKQMVMSDGKQEIFDYTNPRNGNKILDKFTAKYNFVSQMEYDEIILEEYKGDLCVRKSVANVGMCYLFPRE